MFNIYKVIKDIEIELDVLENRLEIIRVLGMKIIFIKFWVV